MAQKKKQDDKKKEPPSEQQEELLQQEKESPVIQIEQEGFGRFEYRDGTTYEGQWKLLEGVKKKHGEGTLIHAGTTAHEQGNEEYEGTWVNDQMEGYGVYKYTSGATYSGEWRNSKHDGRGMYEFPDGSIYDGEWKNHKMHGEGIFIDIEGNKWEGEFVHGIFQSKMQKQLKLEKVLKKKEELILENVTHFFTRFNEAFAKSDKKTYKENLPPFFAINEDIKLYVKEPYSKYEEKKPDEWNDSIMFLKEDSRINVLRSNMNAQIVEPESIIGTQFNGVGQIVEFSRENEQKKANLVLCNVSENCWIIVQYSEQKF